MTDFTTVDMLAEISKARQLPRWRASRLGRECGSRDSPLREVVTGAPSIMGG